MTAPLAEFHLRCTAACPVAQRAMIALAERGRPFAVETVREPPGPDRGPGTVPGLPVLTLRRLGQADVPLTETFAMIELIEDLHPDQPLHPADPVDRARHREMMETGRLIQYHLSSATRAREQNELDMLVHWMRGPLLRAESQLRSGGYAPGARLSNVDVVFAPTLWRLRVLDSACRTFFLSGCPRLTGWAEQVLARPSVRSVLPDTLVQGYLAGLARRGAILVDASHADAWSELVTRTSRVAGMG